MNLSEAIARRAMLAKFMPACPCGERSVQLIDWMVKPARWKCRKCKLQFDSEPPSK